MPLKAGMLRRALVTKVGCSKAGYTPKDIAPMFARIAKFPNIYLPKEFREQLDNI